MRLRLCLLIAIVFAAVTARAATGYSAILDFSATENPSGVWSYGWKEHLRGQFHPLKFPRTQADEAGTSWHIWEYRTYGVQPAFIYFPWSNISTVTSEGGIGQYPPGTLVLATGDESTPQNFAVLRFTVPSHGRYRIATAVQSHLDGSPSGDTDFHVLHNNRIVFRRFLPPVSGAFFARPLDLIAGDTIDFGMGRGRDGVEYGSALKIKAVITPTGGITPPEILVQPRSRQVPVGSSTTFSVKAAGSENLDYRWFFNGEPIPRQSEHILNIRNVQAAQAGTYSVRVRNEAGVVQSSDAVLSIADR